MMSEKESIVSSLYAQKRHHENKIEHWKKQEKDAGDNLRKHQEQLTAIERKLERIQGRDVLITTHFIQRYHSRVNPDSTEEDIRSHVLTDKFLNMVRTLGGSGEYPLDDMYSVIISDFKCITITKQFTEEELKEHRRQKHKKYGRTDK